MEDLNLSMFRAYDIRTPSETLPDELAVRLARAEAVYFAETLGVSGVLVAHDARSTGPRYLQLAVETFVNAGLDVVVVPGVASTCMFYFAAMRHPHLAAVMYGASHNPAGDTGQKILGPGVRPIAAHIGPEGGLDRIRDLYVAGAAPQQGRGRITAYDPTEEYIAYSMQLAGVTPGALDGLRVFHDYLNGAAGKEMMLAFDRAGAQLTPLHFTADGRFPLGDPNPVKPVVIAEGLKVLRGGRASSRAMVSEDAAPPVAQVKAREDARPPVAQVTGFRLGTFFDGDGDRIDFYRGDGQYLSSSFVYAAILPALRQRFTGEGLGVYADLKSNPLAIMEMAKSGVTVNVIRNGHSQIKHAMFEDARMFGTVEESAHFYEAFILDGNRYCTENTLYIALLVARTWHEDPARFDRLFEIQAQTSREREWGYKFPSNQQRAAALDAVQAHFETRGARAMTRMPNGYDLEATMMRRGIPFDITPETCLEPDWLQVCHRISQSEDGLARWEVVAASPEIASAAKREIADIVPAFGAGNEYQG